MLGKGGAPDQGDRRGGARGDLPSTLGRKVHLFLHVKVKPELGRGPRALPGDRAGLGGVRMAGVRHREERDRRSNPNSGVRSSWIASLGSNADQGRMTYGS